MIDWFRNRSLFVKLLLVLVVAALLINLAVGWFFGHFLGSQRKIFGRFIQGCTHYVMESLGDPPQLNKAREVGERMGLDFRLESPDGGFATADGMPRASEVEFHHNRPGSQDRPLRLGRAGDRPILQIQQGNHRLLAIPRFALNDRAPWPELLALLSLLTLLFVGSWYMLRRLFRPLQELDGAVRQVTQGNLLVRLPERSKDELGNLARAFNQMTEQVRRDLHSKEQLLYNVSHELRSPLTRMRLSLEFLPTGKEREALVGELGQMEAMIDELLESARLDSEHGVLDLAPLELGSLLRGLVDRQGPAVELKQPAEDLRVSGDFRRLERLFRNLIENGIKYSPAGSRVEVRLSRQGEQALVEVCDQGPGIPEADLPHLFEPFYRVDKSRNTKTGGYGLGLALVRQIAEAHQGKVSVTCRPLEPTCFAVLLPLIH